MAVSISIASILYFIVMFLFLSCYNVSLRFSCASFFGVNAVNWHSKLNLEKKKYRVPQKYIHFASSRSHTIKTLKSYT